MDDFRSYVDQARGPFLRERFSCFPACRDTRRESGNVLFYVFLAIGLMAALTYSYVKDSRENLSAQNAPRIAEELFVQANLVRSAATQCTMEYPQGGGNLDDTGGSADKIDAADNPNNPYPLEPSSLLNPTPAADDKARNLMCFTAAAVFDDTGTLVTPAVTSNMFSGASNQGRFLPPPPAGFSDWVYFNDANGVYIQTIGPTDSGTIAALGRLMNKFPTCQADLNYGTCGATCFTAWIQRNACP